MTDVLVRKEDGTVQYELTGETYAVPTILSDGPKRWKLWTRLRVPSADTLKNVLNQVKTTDAQNTGDDITERVVGGDGALRSFVIDQFEEISGIARADGTPLSPDAQRQFLLNRGNVTMLIGIAAVLNVSRPQDEIDSEPSFLIFEEDSDTQDIDSEVCVADFDKKLEVMIPVNHLMRAETEEDRQEYRKASKAKSQREGKVVYSWTTTNYGSVEKMYAKMVLSLQGATIDGVACTEDNKSLWVPKVPVSWKAFALNRLFNRVESKNA